MFCGAYVCNLSQQRMLYVHTLVISHDNECCMWHMHVCEHSDDKEFLWHMYVISLAIKNVVCDIMRSLKIR